MQRMDVNPWEWSKNFGFSPDARKQAPEVSPSGGVMSLNTIPGVALERH